MATFVYDHTVKANGRLVPPKTPVEIPDAAEESSTAETKETAAPKKRATRRKAAAK